MIRHAANATLELWRLTGRRNPNMTTEKAVLAGGCFWGVQDTLRRLRGVVSTRVGYTGGDIANPSYGNHQGHAEAIEIVFDPAVVSCRTVLEHFLQVHDPTTYEQQRSDFGSSYRSAIFYTEEQQKETALETIAEIEALVCGRVPW
jgi:peptide-methionine (S)-S-oxide reductase